MSADEEGYNGWTNRATWAMVVNLGSGYDRYQQCEALAYHAAEFSENDADEFHAVLAFLLWHFAMLLLDRTPGDLPDFDPDGHLSSDPKDPHGPDDIEGVNWRELADAYSLDDYI